MFSEMNFKGFHYDKGNENVCKSATSVTNKGVGKLLYECGTTLKIQD